MIWITILSFLKKNFTWQRLFIVAFVLVLIFGYVQSCRLRTVTKQRDGALSDKDEAIKLAVGQKEVTVHYMNKYDQEVSRVKARDLTISNFQDLLESAQLRFGKNFDLNRNRTNVEAIETIDGSLRLDSLTPQVISVPCPDTTKKISAFLYLLDDEYNHIRALVLEKPEIEIKVPIRAAILWKRGKFLFWRGWPARKEWSMEAYSPNKLIRLDSLQIFRIGKKPP